MVNVRKPYRWFIALVLVAVLVLVAWYLHSGTNRGLTAKTAVAVVSRMMWLMKWLQPPNLVIFCWTATTSPTLK